MTVIEQARILDADGARRIEHQLRYSFVQRRAKRCPSPYTPLQCIVYIYLEKGMMHPPNTANTGGRGWKGSVLNKAFLREK